MVSTVFIPEPETFPFSWKWSLPNFLSLHAGLQSQLKIKAKLNSSLLKVQLYMVMWHVQVYIIINDYDNKIICLIHVIIIF